MSFQNSQGSVTFELVAFVSLALWPTNSLSRKYSNINLKNQIAPKIIIKTVSNYPSIHTFNKQPKEAQRRTNTVLELVLYQCTASCTLRDPAKPLYP